MASADASKPVQETQLSSLHDLTQRSQTHAAKAQDQKQLVSDCIKDLNNFTVDINARMASAEANHDAAQGLEQHNKVGGDVTTRFESLEKELQNIVDKQYAICGTSVTLVVEMIEKFVMVTDFTNAWEQQFGDFKDAQKKSKRLHIDTYLDNVGAKLDAMDLLVEEQQKKKLSQSK